MKIHYRKTQDSEDQVEEIDDATPFEKVIERIKELRIKQRCESVTLNSKDIILFFEHTDFGYHIFGKW